MEIDKVYKVIIDQRGSEYMAKVKVDAPFSEHAPYAQGKVIENNYPIDGGWDDLGFRLYEEGQVETVKNNPFNPVGQIVEIEEV